MRKKKVISCVLAGVLALGATQAWAATTHYNDSSVTGGQAWGDWVENWDTMAADYTQVSLTPGCAETELNLAWYSEGTNPTPMVYFGTDGQNMQIFNGFSGPVDPVFYK